MNSQTGNPFIRFSGFLNRKLVNIHDTPQKVALGVGVGVFSGILPGTGPIAALCLALIFRVNRASAILASAVTNFWLSLAILLPSVKLGSMIYGINWQQLYDSWVVFLVKGSWKELFKTSFLKILLPVATGYILVALCLGFLAYLLTFILLRFKRRRNTP